MASDRSTRILNGWRANWRTIFDVLTSIVLVSATLTIVGFYLSDRLTTTATSGANEQPLPAEPISIEAAATKGSEAAPLVVVAFSDFQCPFCARFARDVLPVVERDYISTGRVQLVYRHLPLPMHAYARTAAQAAECAGRQGRFWEMHDRLFGNGTKLDDAVVASAVKDLALDVDRFQECLHAEETLPTVARDSEDARRLGLSGTPAFLLGTREPDGRVRVSRVIAGVLPPEEFGDLLDETLSGDTPFWRRWAGL